jgi:unsaturated rhamnogalacturonyl hydrolase
MKRALVCIIVAGLSLGLMVRSAHAQAPTTQPGAGKVVAEDYFFNHQVQNGKQYHYIWDDATINGYSKFGDVFKSFGATLAHCDHAPTAADLNKYSIYFIVNPSIPANAAGGKPNYMDPASGDAIEAWVKSGGVLCLFLNDNTRSEIEHLDTLSSRFGITFNSDLRNEVVGTNRVTGTFTAAQFPDHPLFKDIKAVYMKEISTITVKDPATPLLVVDNEKHNGKDVIIATSHFGKGFVFAVGDPWFYNEYIDLVDPKIQAIDNRKAATNFANWILGIATPPIQP